MSSNSVHNKRIARNSLLLYGRLIVTMAVTLYTSRVILNVLGEVDYGVYSVVAGIVVMIAYLNNSLTVTTQRFLNYEMGRPDGKDLSGVFSAAVVSHYLIAAIVVVLAETVGLWFVKNHLVIPPERMGAALVVFHCSVVTLFFKIIGSPYNAAVIAHERMKVFALVSILESGLNLLLVALLVMLPYDKLAVYGVLVMLVGIVVRFVYVWYCRTRFPECRARFVFNKDLFGRMFSFSGWMFTGTMTNMLSTQGLNVLINLYFGPVLNAARAIAVKVQGVVQLCIDSLITAVQPQIVKSYSAGETSYMNRLVFTSSKLSFFIVLLLSLPLLLNTELILTLWLKDVPEYAVLFTQLMLIDLLVTCSYAPLGTVSQASGKIKCYQVIISAGFMVIFLLTWACYKMGYPVYYAFIISIAVNFVSLFARLAQMRRAFGYAAGRYLRRVFLPEVAVLLLSWGVALGVTRMLGAGWQMTVMATVVYLTAAVGLIWLLGLDRAEKDFSREVLLKLVKKGGK